MTTLVLGGGLIGVTSAYYLAKSGREVVVLERNDGTGDQTSFQNGALLAPGHSHSWAAPGAPWTLLKSLFERDPMLTFRPSLDPQFWRWGLRFLANCSERQYRENTLRTFRCMNEGLDELRELCAATGIEYDGNENGILYLFRSEASFAKRRDDWNLLRDHGLQLEEVDAARCVEIEPVLGSVREKIGGGFFSPDEAAGDAWDFTRKLTAYCENMGVEFRYGVSIEGLEATKRGIACAHTNKGRFVGDDYLLALGPQAAQIAHTAGVALPIWPVKGYTATLPLSESDLAPQVGIIDEDNLVAFAHLGNRFRVGGEAEFAGFDTTYTADRFRKVFAVTRDLFPGVGNFDEARLWACLRPVSAGGPPIVGESPIGNLFVNVGHGAAGWTEACAVSRAAADIMTGRRPDLDMAGLRLRDL
ncbi:MAG: D-amino acid dehydrogenase [Pseudomonadota bacterium]